jgi:hypothetical protein
MLSHELLSCMAEGREVKVVQVGVDDQKDFTLKID